MDKNSKILSVLFLVLIVISIYLTYKRSFVTKNYEILIPEESQTLEEDFESVE